MADVIALCGSYRSNSLNRKLLRLAIRELKGARLSVEEVDVKTLALPVYDGDLEDVAGLPSAVQALKQTIALAPGLLLVSPEYNGSIPGGLKNCIDWLSRPPTNCFAGRVVSINTASPGPFGGVRATIALRGLLTQLGAWVAPGSMNLAKADAAFDDHGELTEARAKTSLSAAMKTFAEGVKRFR